MYVSSNELPLFTNSDVAQLTDWHMELHRYPQLSGHEE